MRESRGAAGDLAAPIAELSAIDHHAHVLAAPDAAIRLADVLTESRDPRQIEQLRWHPAYRRALQVVAEVLDVDPTEEAIAAGRGADYARHVRALLDRARIEAMFVDDGFGFPGALTLDEHRALVGRPVRRVVRIETEVEAAAVADGWPPFHEVRERFTKGLGDAAAGGAVALKTIAAYRCGLDLPAPEQAAARDAYERWRTTSSDRLTDPALISFFIEVAVEATSRRLPLQVHVGLGDSDLVASRADPLHLQPQLDGVLRDVPVVLLHCYPFVRHAGYLASVYPDVYVDLSLAITLVAHRGAELILQALELAPATKLLYATDASRLPEIFFTATAFWREALTGALGRLVDENYLGAGTAVEWAEAVLAGNARRLYAR